MAFSFTQSPSYKFTSESVTEGHPDKLCDQISDSILDSILADDPMARVACEVSATTGLVVVMGEITTDTYIDIPTTVRNTIKEIGYTDSSYGFDYQSCGVTVSMDAQSQDISEGVSLSLETRESNTTENDEIELLGAGDQGMMFGFACNDTPELMPLPIALAHRICKRMTEIRKTGRAPYLRPDGKSQVTVEYAYGVPKRVDTVLMSMQHDPDISSSIMERDLINYVAKEVIPTKLIDDNTRYIINPSGKFVIGGPVGDTGLTGRKIIVDTYGGFARHGGGAFSGKDPTKVDRSASYAARYVAKNLVAAGLASRLELQISYAIGVSKPTSISVETFGSGKVSDEVFLALIEKHFDLRPGAIIQNLNLRKPIYRQTAAYGHFGREDLNVPWELTDKAEILKNDNLVKEPNTNNPSL